MMKAIAGALLAVSIAASAWGQCSGPGCSGGGIATPVSPANGGSGVTNSGNFTWNGTFTLNNTSGVTETTPATSFATARTDASQAFQGIQTFNNGVVFQQGQVVATRIYVASGGPTQSINDYVIEINKTTGSATPVTLLASPATGKVVYIVDGKGDAATNNITVTPAAGTINGAASYVMNVNRQAVQLVYDGTQWIVI